MTTAILYHGGSETLYLGICLTDSEHSALGYATQKNAVETVTEYEIDLAGLVVVDCGDVHPDSICSTTCPGDDGDTRGADVLVYRETGMWCETHRTWRLMSPAALAAVAA
jgi:hypothetical protein